MQSKLKETYQHHISIHYFSFDSSVIAIPLLYVNEGVIILCYKALKNTQEFMEKIFSFSLLVK